MIKYYNVTSYCCEDISLIENYNKAISNDIIYDCHHRKETDEGLSVNQLKEQNLYFNRPANELIFLPHDEHARLHQTTNNPFKGVPKSLEHKQKLSESLKGRKLSNEHKQNISKGLQGHVGWSKGKTPWNKGLKMSKETPNEQSESHKVRIPWNKGLKTSEETRKKQSEAAKRRPPISEETRKKLSEVTKRRWAKYRTEHV